MTGDITCWYTLHPPEVNWSREGPCHRCTLRQGKWCEAVSSHHLQREVKRQGAGEDPWSGVCHVIEWMDE